MEEPMVDEKPVRDALYYLENVIFLVSGSVIIIGKVTCLLTRRQVEDNLFKVPKQYFQKNSRIFSNVFGNDHTTEGSSDEEPIHLYSIQKVDLERLLAVMYPM